MGTSTLSNDRKVAILVPAYNEEKHLGLTLSTLKAIKLGHIYVADDASTDKTAYIAKSLGASVISAPFNLGKGGIINYAFPHIKEELVILLDADLGKSSQEASLIVEAINNGAELAIGVFRSQGGFGLVRKLASLLLYLKTGRYFKAPLSGQRAALKDIWQRLMPFAPGFSMEVAMLKKACQEGLKIVEVPVKMQDRNYGKGYIGISHRFKQLIAVIRGIRS